MEPLHAVPALLSFDCSERIRALSARDRGETYFHAAFVFGLRTGVSLNLDLSPVATLLILILHLPGRKAMGQYFFLYVSYHLQSTVYMACSPPFPPSFNISFNLDKKLTHSFSCMKLGEIFCNQDFQFLLFKLYPGLKIREVPYESEIRVQFCQASGNKVEYQKLLLLAHPLIRYVHNSIIRDIVVSY